MPVSSISRIGFLKLGVTHNNKVTSLKLIQLLGPHNYAYPPKQDTYFSYNEHI